MLYSSLLAYENCNFRTRFAFSARTSAGAAAGSIDR